MNRSEAYEAGKDRGFCVSTWVETPEIGSLIMPHIDHIGLGDRVDEENQAEYFELMCNEAEEYSRQYSPFEFTAHELNIDEDDSEDLWDAFTEGIFDGIHQECANRF